MTAGAAGGGVTVGILTFRRPDGLRESLPRLLEQVRQVGAHVGGATLEALVLPEELVDRQIAGWEAMVLDWGLSCAALHKDCAEALNE